jgi:hypothetical protein
MRLSLPWGKVEITRSQGTAASCQELYRVAERADGLVFREDDAEPELLDDESIVLEDGDVVAMAVEVSGYNRARQLLMCSTMTHTVGCWQLHVTDNYWD